MTEKKAKAAPKKAAKPKAKPKAKRTAPKELLKHCWKPGQSGNPKGRPPGSRNKLDEAFIEALLKDFRDNGADAIIRCRFEKPEAYLNVIAKVLPKQVEGHVDHDHQHTHKTESVSETAQWLEKVIGAGSDRKAQKPLPN